MQRRFGACGVLLICTSIVLSAGAATADEPSTSPALTSAEVYDDAFHILSSGGDEKNVEEALKKAEQVFPNDARLVFFSAACARCYFYTARAVPMFQKAADLDGNGIWAQAGRLIIGMDMGLGDREQQFQALDQLSQANPREPLLLWMVGVQCRAQKRNEVGAQRFATLLKMMDPGPAIVHHTYANILDELGRWKESLPHRVLAVKLHPASWTYQGQANTLSRLKRWKEADAVYKLALALNPLDSLIWRNWAWSKRARGDEAGARMDLQIAQFATEARSDIAARQARLSQAAWPRPFSQAATGLYNSAIDSWRKGDQAKTEAALVSGYEQFTNDPRFPFFLGVCYIAQSKIAPAKISFQRAVTIDPHGDYGLAGDYAATFNNPFESKLNLQATEKLLAGRPDDPALLWIAAMEATYVHLPVVSLSYYAKLAPTLNAGPAVVYVQYADCLESLTRFGEALARRQAAVRLEPSADNFQRLGITFSDLAKWDEADAAYRKSTTLDPGNASRWDEWAQSEQQRGDAVSAAKLRHQADSLRKPPTRASTKP